jgi:hypothetical protein
MAGLPWELLLPNLIVVKLSGKLNGWNDDVVVWDGKTYKKCFLKPYYKY